MPGSHDRTRSMRPGRPQIVEAAVAAEVDAQPRGTQAAVAARLGVSPTTVSRYLDEDEPCWRIQADDLPDLCAALGSEEPLRRAVEHRRIAGRWWTLRPAPRRSRDEDVLTEAGDLAASASAVVQTATRAYADGVLDADERSDLRARVREARQELEALEAALEDPDAGPPAGPPGGSARRQEDTCDR